MKKVLLGLAAVIGMATAGAIVTPASAGVDVSIGIGGPFWISHDRCYDYWFRVRHPDYCYYGDYNEYWWGHHGRGWDRDDRWRDRDRWRGHDRDRWRDHDHGHDRGHDRGHDHGHDHGGHDHGGHGHHR